MSDLRRTIFLDTWVKHLSKNNTFLSSIDNIPSVGRKKEPSERDVTSTHAQKGQVGEKRAILRNASSEITSHVRETMTLDMDNALINVTEVKGYDAPRA